MENWTKDVTPAIADLTSPQETALRSLYGAHGNDATTPLFVEYPALIPTIWLEWDPTATIICRNQPRRQIVVIFKHTSGESLFAVELDY